MEEATIDFLLFSVKKDKVSMADVGIDLQKREFRIETVDLYGHLISNDREGKLRKNKVKLLKEMFSQIQLLNWPKLKQPILPIHLKDAMLLYSIDGDLNHTIGKSVEDRKSIHKALEITLGTTFGSYEFYQE